MAKITQFYKTVLITSFCHYEPNLILKQIWALWSWWKTCMSDNFFFIDILWSDWMNNVIHLTLKLSMFCGIITFSIEILRFLGFFSLVIRYNSNPWKFDISICHFKNVIQLSLYPIDYWFHYRNLYNFLHHEFNKSWESNLIKAETKDIFGKHSF